MERRGALKIAGSVLVGAGALYGARRVLSRHPGPASSVEFYGIGHDFEKHPAESQRLYEKGPVVDVDTDAKEIVADGYHYYGSSSCDTSEFGGLEYDDSEDTVRAVVQPSRKNTYYLGLLNPFNLGCTADLAGTKYRIVVSFEHLPERFVVEERNEAYGTKVSMTDIGSAEEEGPPPK